MSEVRVVVSSLEGFINQLIKKLVLDITANLRRAPSEGGTPVDTGWARANWIPRVGQPFDGTAGTRAQAEAGRVTEAEINRGAAQILSYDTSKGPAYITNNVPYVPFLNEGSSRQAPRGFVQKAIREAITQLGFVTSKGPAPRDPITGRFIPRS